LITQTVNQLLKLSNALLAAGQSLGIEKMVFEGSSALDKDTEFFH